MRTNREIELMLATAIDAAYYAFSTARELADDAGNPELLQELQAMARRCRRISQDLLLKNPPVKP